MPEDKIPIAPLLQEARFPDSGVAHRRILTISALAILVAIGAGFIAEILTSLIGFVTNLAFYGRISADFVSPAENELGLAVILIPVIGGLVVGLMARYGSAAIRGHGIPEAMETILLNESKVSPSVTFLKPLSAAVAIGTGGPFGAEGPIIATGGAFGSLFGQFLRTTADERKVLLCAGAAAGMAATFGSPVAAVLLAIELLLFEYRARSLVPVALAAATAAGIRALFHGTAPIFHMSDTIQVPDAALPAYIVLGAAVGITSVYVTRGVYAVEDLFERLPVHWMWWPAIGAVAVGVVGYIAPRTLGVGYDNIDAMLNGTLTVRVIFILALFKLISWTIALGSGTSGGTLAPLFTIGGGAGALLGSLGIALFPGLGLDIRLAALVGMAAMFAGASRALLTSVVFAFEITRQPIGLLPLLVGCSAAYMASVMMMRHTIMTEKLARRGMAVPSDYAADYLDQLRAEDFATSPVTTVRADHTLGAARRWIGTERGGSTHQGFPVVDAGNQIVGVVTRRDLMEGGEPDSSTVGSIIKRPPVVAYPDSSLRDVADHMVREKVGRIPIVTRGASRTVLGILSRSDLLVAHERRLTMTTRATRTIALWPRPRPDRGGG